jgi:hypothetical protein
MTVDHTSSAGRRAWIGLAVLALPTLLVSIDTFVVLLAFQRGRGNSSSPFTVKGSAESLCSR